MRPTGRCNNYGIDLFCRRRVWITSALLLLFIARNSLSGAATTDSDGIDSSGELIETIVSKDSDGREHEEFAFRAPMAGLPTQVLEMFCASTKMRLYWDVFRDEIKTSTNKGINLRRLTRLAKHVYEDVRDVDKPFGAEEQLSVVDEYFGVSSSSNDDEDGATTPSNTSDVVDRNIELSLNAKAAKKLSKPKSIIKSLKHKLSPSSANKQQHEAEQQQEDPQSRQLKPTQQQTIESIDLLFPDQLIKPDAKTRIKIFVKEWIPKVTLGIYTRIRTMWWMVTACLFTKYYLWNPALDEFTKLKRSLVMWPELQLLDMKDLQCKPLRLFRRVLDLCKLLNPLLRIDFGQLSLD